MMWSRVVVQQGKVAEARRRHKLDVAKAAERAESRSFSESRYLSETRGPCGARELASFTVLGSRARAKQRADLETLGDLKTLAPHEFERFAWQRLERTEMLSSPV